MEKGRKRNDGERERETTEKGTAKGRETMEKGREILKGRERNDGERRERTEKGRGRQNGRETTE